MEAETEADLHGGGIDGEKGRENRREGQQHDENQADLKRACAASRRNRTNCLRGASVPGQRRARRQSYRTRGSSSA